ncbi:hypothetical protein F5Y11DRAFT_346956 [Daldinia sp. FL1419]|nr:hypothetical protein F5Y11DRAFT_346956 [Daldinia sp. FL1419]
MASGSGSQRGPAGSGSLPGSNSPGEQPGNDNQQVDLNAAINAILAHLTQLTQLVKALQGHNNNGLSGTGNSGAGNSNTNHSALTSEEVGYFNPGSRDTENFDFYASDEYPIYSNVHAFTDRLLEMAAIRGEEAVKRVWTTCLQGSAQGWLTTELTRLEKRGLQNGNIKDIAKALVQKFKKDDIIAQSDLMEHSFTLRDIREGKSMCAFVHAVIRDAKDCNLPRFNQLLFAFNGFDGYIQSQLQRPTVDTTVGQFINCINERGPVLRNMAYSAYPPF